MAPDQQQVGLESKVEQVDLSSLVLTRKPGESILIGDHVRVSVSKINGNRASIYIEAPRDVRIRRSEPPSKEALTDG